MPIRCSVCPLRRAGLFSALRDSDGPLLHCRLRPNRQPRRQLLALAGEGVDEIHVVQSGVLREFCSSPGGDESTLRLVFPGDLLGIEGLDGADRAANVQALTAATVCAVGVKELLALVDQDVELAHDLLKVLVRSHVRAQRQAQVAGAGPARRRVAALLLLLRERSADSTPPRGRGSVRLPLTRRDMACVLNARPETISRMLASLSREGVIELGQGWFRVLDLEALESSAKPPAAD